MFLFLIQSENKKPMYTTRRGRPQKAVKKMLEEADQSSASSSIYPNYKRQRRVSYSAAYLLESVLPLREGSEGNAGGLDKEAIQEFRAQLLSIPSTRQRMRVVLEAFHRWRLYQEWDEFA